MILSKESRKWRAALVLEEYAECLREAYESLEAARTNKSAGERDLVITNVARAREWWGYAKGLRRSPHFPCP